MRRNAKTKYGRETRGKYGVLEREPEAKRDHLENPDVDERIILRWICRRWDVGIWTGLGWLRIETGDGRL